MTQDEWEKLEPRVQKNLLDANHQMILNTYDKTIREALKLGAEKAKAEGRSQLDVAVVIIDKNDSVVKGLPEDKRAGMTFDYNVLFGYREELAQMAPWGDPKHEYYKMMQQMEDKESAEEPGEISVWAAVFAYDVATIRRLHFSPKKIDLKPAK